MKIMRFSELDSTQTYAKTLLQNRENLFIVADRQTGGRGTKGRSFSSLEGGVYLTKLAFYRDFPAKDAFLIMARAAVAVCATLESFGLCPKIKWANDVYVNDKKICGILIENTFSGGQISASLVGVGLNVNNALLGELDGIAVSMAEATGAPMDKREVERRLIEALQKPYAVEEYIRRMGYLDRTVRLIEGEKESAVRACGVTEQGELIVEENGKTRLVRAGEVSLRI